MQRQQSRGWKRWCRLVPSRASIALVENRAEGATKWCFVENAVWNVVRRTGVSPTFAAWVLEENPERRKLEAVALSRGNPLRALALLTEALARVSCDDTGTLRARLDALRAIVGSRRVQKLQYSFLGNLLPPSLTKVVWDFTDLAVDEGILNQIVQDPSGFEHWLHLRPDMDERQSGWLDVGTRDAWTQATTTIGAFLQREEGRYLNHWTACVSKLPHVKKIRI